MKAILFFVGLTIFSSSYLDDKVKNLVAMLPIANAFAEEGQTSVTKNVRWDSLFSIDSRNHITAKRNVTSGAECMMFRNGYSIYTGEKIVRHHLSGGEPKNSMWLLQDNPLENIHFKVRESDVEDMVVIESCMFIPS